MGRFVKITPVILLVALSSIALVPTPTPGQGGQSALLPPTANFRGKSLAEWNVLWANWNITTQLGDPTGLSNTVEKVRLLPDPLSPGVYAFDIVVDPGTAFVLPAWFVFGEHYAEYPVVPDDTPELIDELMLFETTFVETRLDGRVVLRGFASDLDAYRFGPVYFDPPIAYTEPQDRGGPHAVEALFVEGIGSVYQPMSAGKHTLVLTTDSPFFGHFEVTYRINVVPPGRR
jgi:hypothetical protein